MSCWFCLTMSILLGAPSWAANEKPAVSATNGFVSGTFTAGGEVGDHADNRDPFLTDGAR